MRNDSAFADADDDLRGRSATREADALPQIGARELDASCLPETPGELHRAAHVGRPRSGIDDPARPLEMKHDPAGVECVASWLARLTHTPAVASARRKPSGARRRSTALRSP